LDTNDKLISGDILEDTLGNILELDTDLDLGLVESYVGGLAKTLQLVEQNSPLPALRMKGTPSHLGLFIQRVVAAYVGQTELRGTVSSSR
jgi:hypothetical protein